MLVCVCDHTSTARDKSLKQQLITVRVCVCVGGGDAVCTCTHIVSLLVYRTHYFLGGLGSFSTTPTFIHSYTTPVPFFSIHCEFTLPQVMLQFLSFSVSSHTHTPTSNHTVPFYGTVHVPTGFIKCD